MSLALEEQALLQGESAVLLSTFQEAHYFPKSTRTRYARLAGELAFVGALAVDLDREPAPGVRGSALDLRDSAGGGNGTSWCSGPHFAGAFVARDLGDCGPDSSRRFQYVVTYDRELVVAAAMRLMSRIAPLAR